MIHAAGDDIMSMPCQPQLRRRNALTITKVPCLLIEPQQTWPTPATTAQVTHYATGSSLKNERCRLIGGSTS
jgi:hypothetical protein